MRKLRCLNFSVILVVFGFTLATLFSYGIVLYDAVPSRKLEKTLGILGKASLGKAQTAFVTKILCRSRPEYFNHERIKLDPTVVNEVETVLMFIGYPRSGHTLIGSLLDAHPNMVIANEYNILGNWENFTKEHRNKQHLFEQLYTNSFIEAQQGDRSSKDCVPKTKYNYLVPNQWQGKFDGKLKVIGDKKGGATTLLLNRSQKYWSLLEEIRKEVKRPLKFIHVIRNPFDNIATIVLRKLFSSNLNWTKIYKTPVTSASTKLIKRTRYHMKFAMTNAQLLRHLGDKAYTVRSEDFIANPRLELRKICQFLNIHCSNKYITESTSIVNSKVSRSRNGIIWDDEVKNIVLTYIRRIPFYRDYKFQE